MGKSSGANWRQAPSSQGSPVWQRCSVTFGPRISSVYRWWVLKNRGVFTHFSSFLPRNMVFLIMFHHFSSFLPRSFNTFNTATDFFRNSVNSTLSTQLLIFLETLWTIWFCAAWWLFFMFLEIPGPISSDGLPLWVDENDDFTATPPHEWCLARGTTPQSPHFKLVN